VNKGGHRADPCDTPYCGKSRKQVFLHLHKFKVEIEKFLIFLW
jgi:hypothetical protein